MARLDTTKIEKGDLVRFRGSSIGWTVLSSERTYWGESYPYTTKDWFEVVAPFKGSDLLTVKFAKIDGNPVPTRKSLEVSKSFVLEIKRPEKAPVYKKQLVLF